MTLRDMLSCIGYSVAEASTGAQAIEACRKLQPNIVMVDANAKDMDGAKAIEWMRRDDPSVVALICASSGQRNVISQAFSAGAVGFCPKPYREKNVKAALRSIERQPVFC